MFFGRCYYIYDYAQVSMRAVKYRNKCLGKRKNTHTALLTLRTAQMSGDAKDVVDMWMSNAQMLSYVL